MLRTQSLRIRAAEINDTSAKRVNNRDVFKSLFQIAFPF